MTLEARLSALAQAVGEDVGRIQVSQAASLPQFVFRDTPIFTRDDSPWLLASNQTLYWPCLVHAKKHYPAAIDEWYLYYSSDHASGQGGIGLATAPHPSGPWTDSGSAIYVDTVEGQQTETPQVVWNEDTNLFHMYYQNKMTNADQSTYLVTSPNGVDSWTRLGKVIDVDTPRKLPGDGHTGYARIYRVGKKWVAHHLCGGTAKAHFGVSYSDDGVDWLMNPRIIPARANLSGDLMARRVTSSSTWPFWWRGSRFAMMSSSPLIAGAASDGKDISLATFESPYKMTPVQRLLGPGAFPWAADTVHQPFVAEADGVLALVFLAKNASNMGVIGLAEASL